MVAEVFANREKDYLSWVKRTPKGYVLTTTRKIPLGYMSLHRASCGKISAYTRDMARGAFTERKYIKVCASSPQSLIAWIQSQGGAGFSMQCKFCKPAFVTNPRLSKIRRTNLQAVVDSFEAKVLRASLDDPKSRRRRLKNAPKKPSKRVVRTTVFQRSSDVVAEVRLRARGKCERCKKLAPFARFSDGTPYLEVHHIIHLASGGDDTVANALALCPNCHREAHFGKQQSAN
jgi:5-methylcytosine-specific restriction endonuclease McrA